MKERVLEKVKSIGVYGILHYGETQRFYDDSFSTKENLYQYRISKIKVFLGDKNSILGLQAFYKNTRGEEVPGAEGRDKNIKELDIKILEIPPNDFLCNLGIFVGDDYITKLIFRTRKGKELIVGNDDGEDRTVSQLNSSKENIILSLYGGYRKNLELISCRYVPISDYLGPTIGYFELKRKLKHEDFKQNILDNLSNLSEKDKVLFQACCLPDNVFNEIIKYCLY
jgi:hypothetical protein